MEEPVLYHCFFYLALLSGCDTKKKAKEVSTMLSFEHSNVMSLIGVCIEGEMPLLIMPFMPNGSLLEFLRHHRQELLFSSATEPQVVTIPPWELLEFCKGLEEHGSTLLILFTATETV